MKEDGRRHPKMGKPKLKIVGGSVKRQPEQTPEERTYFRELHQLIDSIFERAADEYQWTWNQLAAHAILGYQTVSNLGDRITRFPHFLTIHKLAKAVGWDIAVKEGKVHKKASTAKVKIVG